MENNDLMAKLEELKKKHDELVREHQSSQTLFFKEGLKTNLFQISDSMVKG